MKVLIVDDHSAVRLGIRMVLEASSRIEVVGEAADGHQAVAMARALGPEVVLMDLRMPVMDGIAATAALREHGTAKVLVLTTFDDDEYLFGALQAGAHGFLLKSAEPEQIIDAVLAVAAGRAVLSPELTARVIKRAVRPAPAAPRREPLPESLTEREIQVLRGLGQGLSNPQIAAQLGIGESTVKTHASRVMDKLGVQTRLQAARVAFAQWG